MYPQVHQRSTVTSNLGTWLESTYNFVLQNLVNKSNFCFALLLAPLFYACTFWTICRGIGKRRAGKNEKEVEGQRTQDHQGREDETDS